MVEFVVLLILTVNDTGSGLQLERKTSVVSVVAQSYDDPAQTVAKAIEQCRKYGVLAAYDLSQWWQANGHPWASTNVDCEWERGTSQ